MGVCEYKNSNYEKAYGYLISAKSQNFGNRESLEKFLKLCSIQIQYNTDNLDSNLNFPFTEKNELVLNSYRHKIQVQLLNLIFLLIALTGIITALFLLYKYRKIRSNIFLSLFVTAISLALFELVLYWQEFYTYTPAVSMYRVLFFLWAPSLYLYIKTKFVCTEIKRSELIAHYSLFIVVLICLIIFGNFSGVAKEKTNFILKGIDFLMNNNWIKTLQLLLYLFLIIKNFKIYKNQIQTATKNWIKTLIVFITILILFLSARAGYEHIYAFDYISKYFIAVYLILFLTILEILLIVQPDIITGTINTEQIKVFTAKYKNSGLTDNMRERVKSQLLDLLNNDKIYLDNTLTLAKLAKLINVDRYSVSQVINQELNKNFYELINDYRIEEAVRIIETNSNKQVIDLIYECGFNNKVSFYKAFKKRMHMTPKDYIEKQY
ncbi:helix-turn-helix domain-containing protein [uncultured Maribacter sp.]|uniref:helix-turn-helix domain-containing protein n=1 Tax=uncultured Maribacter sp. TaxID=431308 RepID=UPI0030EC1B41